MLDEFEVLEDGSSSIISLDVLQEKGEITSAALEALNSDGSAAEFSVSDLHARTYNGGMSSQALVDFINSVAGLDRIVGGGIHREAGRIAEMDSKAVTFMVALRSGNGDEAVVAHKEARAAMERECSESVPAGGTSDVSGTKKPPTYYDRIDGDGASPTEKEEPKIGSVNARSSKRCMNMKLYTDIMERVLRPEAGIMWVSKEIRRVNALVLDTANVIMRSKRRFC